MFARVFGVTSERRAAAMQRLLTVMAGRRQAAWPVVQGLVVDAGRDRIASASPLPGIEPRVVAANSTPSAIRRQLRTTITAIGFACSTTALPQLTAETYTAHSAPPYRRFSPTGFI